jgi:2-phosphoglycerate kinase
MAKYLAKLDDIRRIQDVIVERAGRAGVPVIENANIEAAIGEVMELVLAAAGRVHRRVEV